VKEEDLRGEGERIEKEAQWGRRPVFGLQVEEETVPYPTLIPVVKRPQKVAIDLVDALREIKVCASSDLLRRSSNLQVDAVAVTPLGISLISRWSGCSTIFAPRRMPMPHLKQHDFVWFSCADLIDFA
jgi:hypothetical protein